MHGIKCPTLLTVIIIAIISTLYRSTWVSTSVYQSASLVKVKYWSQSMGNKYLGNTSQRFSLFKIVSLIFRNSLKLTYWKYFENIIDANLEMTFGKMTSKKFRIKFPKSHSVIDGCLQARCNLYLSTILRWLYSQVLECS